MAGLVNFQEIWDSWLLFKWKQMNTPLQEQETGSLEGTSSKKLQKEDKQIISVF